ncbi:MAG: radical SAM family heme chaperone HemW [Candidatus Zixiibacteriota bacterium]|nr:MAG: radical SAM family heme chaperone HemW [candidate division Zixibacteria bacterium]
MNKLRSSSAGIYLHFPFCESKCPYCDFYSTLIDDNVSTKFMDAVIAESNKEADSDFGSFIYDTIYFGGGTPSLMNPDEINRLLENLQANFNIEKNAEITIECNPSFLTEKKMKGYLKSGINRISLGVQSFNEANLKTLGRLHTPDEAVKTYRIMRDSGFKNVSIDLIYGIPHQTIAEWESDLKTAIELGPDHISAYNLVIESGTEFGRLYSQNRLNLPSDEEQLQMYDSLNEHLNNAGYRGYEISNFSLPGFECLHNLKYWTGKPYLGFGPSAVSFDGKVRRKNRADIESYLKSAEKNIEVPSETEIIDRESALRESIMSGLRLTAGVSLERLKDRFDYDLREDKRNTIDSLLTEGMITIEDGFLKLADKALFISDSVMVKLI